jgi:hypothetical protein
VQQQNLLTFLTSLIEQSAATQDSFARLLGVQEFLVKCCLPFLPSSLPAPNEMLFSLVISLISRATLSTKGLLSFTFVCFVCFIFFSSACQNAWFAIFLLFNFSFSFSFSYLASSF